jgi:hypothetical protein
MEKFKTRLQQARVEAGYVSASDAARRHGWLTPQGNASTYISYENGQTPVPDDVAQECGKAYGVNPAWIKYLSEDKLLLSDRRSRVMPDGERVKLAQLEPEQSRAVAAVMTGMKSEIWRITSEMMVGFDPPCLPGHIVVVDMTARPKPQNMVLAEFARVPIFRMYTRLYLWSFHMTAYNAPIRVDNAKLTIKGVVLPSFRLSV